MIELSHLRCFSITGPDALAFGQSQITAHVDTFLPNHWHPSAWCDGQGKVRATILVRVGHERMDWVLPTAQIDKIRQDLQPFAIGRRVEFGTPTPVCGEFSDNPSHPLSFDLSRGLDINSSLSGDPTQETPASFFDRWRCADILHGWAWLTPELSQSFLPQALGLERLGGLSYKKGCYPGQEVIAKVHYRGKSKQHLVLIRWSGEFTQASANTPIMCAPSSDPTQMDPHSRPIGTLLDSAGGWALAVINTEYPAGTEVQLGQPTIIMGQIQDLKPLSRLDPLS